MIYAALFVFAILRGFNALSVKTLQRDYVKKASQTIYLTALLSLAQGIFLFVTPPFYRYSFSFKMLLYPLGYSMFYAIGYVLFINSLSAGPTSLSNIVFNFQLLVPIIAGLLIWNESISLPQLLGLVLFGVILWLFNQSSYKSEGSPDKLSLKWAVMVLGAALCTGIAVIFTKQYVIVYGTSVKEYLIAYNLIVVLITLPYLLVMRKKGLVDFTVGKRFFSYSSAAGITQNITNIIFMCYITQFKSALFFPLTSILGIISIVLMSRFVLKEKISPKAYIGIALSIVAIYLLGSK